MTVDWSLDSCCDTFQVITIVLFFIFLVITIVFFHWKAFLPLKLLTVFLHEFGHASACWITCGHVDGMTVNEDQGGQTLTRGGVAWVMLPAGYLGSSFWGCFFFIMGSINDVAAAVAACLLCFALFAVLVVFAKNWTLRWVCILFVALTLFLVIVDLVIIPDSSNTSFRILPYYLMFIGVANGAYAVIDIYDDLIRRQVAASDASKFAEICGCCTSKGWGLLWGLISVGLLTIALYIALAINS